MVQTLSLDDLVVHTGQGTRNSSDMESVFRTEVLGGCVSVMEGKVLPKHLLAPHTHENEDQMVFLLEGALEFEIGGADGLRFSAKTGDYVLKPRKLSHAFWNAGEETCRYLELSTGTGFEQFIDGREDGISGMLNAGLEGGMQIHLERIPELMEKHGLEGLAGGNISNIGSLLNDPGWRKLLQDSNARAVIKFIAGKKLASFLRF